VNVGDKVAKIWSQTHQPRVSIEAADDAVSLGITATVRLVLSETRSAAQLPPDAIYNYSLGSSVRVVTPEGAHLRRAFVNVIEYQHPGLECRRSGGCAWRAAARMKTGKSACSKCVARLGIERRAVSAWRHDHPQHRHPGRADRRATRSGSRSWLSTLGLARAVVLAAPAAVLANIPLSESVFWPLAITLMGRILVATGLTLLFLPALYAFWFCIRQPESGTKPSPGIAEADELTKPAKGAYW
jgi:hypothetical protein